MPSDDRSSSRRRSSRERSPSKDRDRSSERSRRKDRDHDRDRDDSRDRRSSRRRRRSRHRSSHRDRSRSRSVGGSDNDADARASGKSDASSASDDSDDDEDRRRSRKRRHSHHRSDRGDRDDEADHHHRHRRRRRRHRSRSRDRRPSDDSGSDSDSDNDSDALHRAKRARGSGRERSQSPSATTEVKAEAGADSSAGSTRVKEEPSAVKREDADADKDSSRGSRRDRDRDRDRSDRGHRDRSDRERDRERDRDRDRDRDHRDRDRGRSDRERRDRERDRVKAEPGSVKRERSPSSDREHASSHTTDPLSSVQQAQRLAKVKELLAANPLLRAQNPALFGGAAGMGDGDDADDDPTAKPFVWKKKVEEVARTTGARVDISAAAYQAKLIANHDEITRLQQRRVERDRERADNELFREQMQRDLDMEANLGWDAKEEEFHRLQMLRRSEIRLMEGRPQPVDVLAKAVHIKLLLDDPETLAKAGTALGESAREIAAREAFMRALEVDMLPPPQLIQTLPLQALGTCARDADELAALGASTTATGNGGEWVRRYWEAVAAVARREAMVTRQAFHDAAAAAAAATAAADAAAGSSQSLHHRRTAAALAWAQDPTSIPPAPARAAAAASLLSAAANITRSAAEDVASLLARRSLAAVDALAAQVSAKVAEFESQAAARTGAGGEGADEAFWRAVQSELALARARAWLTAFHRCLIRQRLRQLRAQAAAEDAKAAKEAASRGDIPRGFGETFSQPQQEHSGAASAEAVEAAAAAAAISASSASSAAPVPQQQQQQQQQQRAGDTDDGYYEDDGDDAAAIAAAASAAAASASAAADAAAADAAIEAAAAEDAAEAAAFDSAALALIHSCPRPPAPVLVLVGSLPLALRGDRLMTSAGAAQALELQRSAVLSERAEEPVSALVTSARLLAEKKAALAQGRLPTVKPDGRVDLFGTTPGPAASVAATEASVAAAAAEAAVGLPSLAASTTGAAGSGLVGSELLASERRLAAGEEAFDADGEVAIADEHYGWQDKWRPRKPRYFNKVRTGFDWTKYNRAHYDKENPPPKIVQGYKFNIFYPDLIDPSKAPTFKVLPDPDGNPDFCVLRFSAGAPYEDVAFKIVRKTWSVSPKHGFKCTFQRGVLSLWFTFKRVAYRR